MKIDKNKLIRFFWKVVYKISGYSHYDPEFVKMVEKSMSEPKERLTPELEKELFGEDAEEIPPNDGSVSKVYPKFELDENIDEFMQELLIVAEANRRRDLEGCHRSPSPGFEMYLYERNREEWRKLSLEEKLDGKYY